MKSWVMWVMAVLLTASGVYLVFGLKWAGVALIVGGVGGIPYDRVRR